MNNDIEKSFEDLEQSYEEYRDAVQAKLMAARIVWFIIGFIVSQGIVHV